MLFVASGDNDAHRWQTILGRLGGLATPLQPCTSDHESGAHPVRRDRNDTE
ncbi:hypothetical protein HRbin20_01637 [bacterium HR20]|nr:hypothetical protein HRbin20_01637 [bacterium HR20]